MNEVLSAIRTRRSVRSFTEQPIPRDMLEQIVQAAIYAPSAMNRQLWKFTVVQNPEMLRRLAGAVAKELGRGEDYNFYRPNAIIIASNERTNAHGREDCACALQNIFLAAHSLGIGSVWINQLKDTCDAPGVRAVLSELHLPQEHIVCGVAALGYPAMTPEDKPRREGTCEWIF